jgi:hypothetical protein
VDARSEEAIAGFLDAANAAAPLELVVFNIGANVNFPILETTERVFRKVWEMACHAGFLTGREAARHLLANNGGSIFFTGATASMRGGSGYAASASSAFAPSPVHGRELGRGTSTLLISSSTAVDTPRVRERIARRREHRPRRRLMDPRRSPRPGSSIAEAGRWTTSSTCGRPAAGEGKEGR